MAGPGHVGVPAQGHHVGGQDLEVDGDKPEVEELEGDPHRPVGFDDREEVVAQLVGDLRGVALQRHDGRHDGAHEDGGKEELVGSHARHRPRRAGQRHLGERAVPQVQRGTDERQALQTGEGEGR